MLNVIEPQTPDHFDAVRRLCWDYRDFLMTLDEKSQRIVQTFYPREKYGELLDAIEAVHTPPEGGARLALKDGHPVGCGMFHTLEPGVAEIKRVFVSEKARGTGAGYALMQALVSDCRALGFDLIRMDTGIPLQSAVRLYLSMGFCQRDAYYEIPELAEGHILFFEMSLRPDGAWLAK